MNQWFYCLVFGFDLQRQTYHWLKGRGLLQQLMKQALDALEAMDALSKMANERKISLQDLAKQAFDGLERAGGTG